MAGLIAGRTGERARSALRWIGGAAAYASWRTALVLIVILINPFGSIEGGEILSHRIWQTIHADRYRTDAKANAIDHITVVTLDDASMKGAAPPDTAPDSIHLMQVFRTIAQAGADDAARPKALFIDLLLGDFAPDATAAALLDFDKTAGACPDRLDARQGYDRTVVNSPFQCLLQGIARLTGYADRPGQPNSGWQHDRRCFQNELAKLDCINRAHGIPVMIASAVDPRQRKAANPSAGAEALADVALSVPILVNERMYALAYPDVSAERENSAFSLYPAAMLYAAWCTRGGSPCATTPVLPPDPGRADATGSQWYKNWRWSGHFDRPIDVTWGVGTPDHFSNLADSMGSGTMAGRCRIADPRTRSTIAAFLKAWFSGLGFVRATPCIYQHHLSYADLQRGLNNPELPGFAAEALAGKLVLIGMTNSESNDYIAAGPHARLPGVFYHAMALDNLIEWGKGYPTIAYPILPPLSITDQDCMNALAAFLMLLAGGLVHQWVKKRDGEAARPWHHLGRAVIVIAGVALYMLTVLFLLTGQLSLLPEQFNIAALSIVLVAEMIQITAALTVPLFRPLFARMLRRAARLAERELPEPHVDGSPTIDIPPADTPRSTNP